MPRVTLVTVVLLSSLSLIHAQGPRRDGRWQVSVEMNMPGMPGGMPPLTVEQCVTKEEADDPTSVMPKGPGNSDGQDCKFSDQKIDGNAVSWSMSCTMPLEMTGSGEFTYGTDTFEGVTKMEMHGQTMTTKYAGTRLGECVK